LDGNGDRFIESKGDRSYRISTHPDFVIVEKRGWLVKKYDELKEAIRTEREKRESGRRKREEEEIERALSKRK
jgi:ribonuclease PH